MTDLKLCQDIVFLALVMWREARGESQECRTGVGCSILNRVKRPSWWGKDVLSVCTKKWQYSSMTDPKDKQLTKWPLGEDPSWLSCLALAAKLLMEDTPNPVPAADSYYDTSIPPPKWATAETFVGQIGRIRFYNLDSDTEV